MLLTETLPQVAARIHGTIRVVARKGTDATQRHASEALLFLVVHWRRPTHSCRGNRVVGQFENWRQQTISIRPLLQAITHWFPQMIM
jgi:hypothetical protein